MGVRVGRVALRFRSRLALAGSMSGSHAITIRRDFDPVDDRGRVVEVKREFGIRADGLINREGPRESQDSFVDKWALIIATASFDHRD